MIHTGERDRQKGVLYQCRLEGTYISKTQLTGGKYESDKLADFGRHCS